jgi:hypothetical protein
MEGSGRGLFCWIAAEAETANRAQAFALCGRRGAMEAFARLRIRFRIIGRTAVLEGLVMGGGATPAGGAQFLFGNGALGEIRTPILTYSRIWSFGLQSGERDKSRGRAEGCPWIYLVLRQNPRATGQSESHPCNQLSDCLFSKIAESAQLSALCLPGIAIEQLSERFPLSY